MIDPPTRLRRAILTADPILVRRLITTHPSLLRNPDFADKSNTSLHLAATYGHVEIAHLLVRAGHEDGGEISRNTDHDTPLMLAARHAQVEVGKLLIKAFPQCVQYTNARGLDALSIAAQNPSSTPLVPLLLSPALGEWAASPHTWDTDGNTPLHHASASGSLKTLRILLAAGANPLAKNHHDWTPLAYSQTVAAEVYFKNLVAELERRKVEGLKEMEERERQRAAGVRVVGADDEGGSVGGTTPRKGDGGVPMTPVDEDDMIQDALKRHWSPTMERRRPMTPGSGGKAPPGHGWDSRLVHMRSRSGSGV